ncbi:MAG: DUF3310 domain-containing protein [Clostridiales bacterium]|nr:DUF3310 domain-containing protein [Clostridiales bacterium]
MNTPNTLKDGVAVCKSTLVKHYPIVLMAAGIAGAVASTAMVYKATTKKSNHPRPYVPARILKDDIDVIDVLYTFTRDLDGLEAVCTSQAIFYILQWHNRNGVEDLKKANWCLDILIRSLENHKDEEPQDKNNR